jgi:rhodanese-related sulfurtransferase
MQELWDRFSFEGPNRAPEPERSGNMEKLAEKRQGGEGKGFRDGTLFHSSTRRAVSLWQGAVLLAVLLCPALLFADYFQTIPMAEVARLMGRPGVALFDVNVQKVWEKHHLRGAVHIEDAKLAKFLPADKSALLIFYCANPLCEASGLAADESILLGYRKVYVMADGIFGWVKAGYPVESAAPGNAEPAVSHDHGAGGHEEHGGHEGHHEMP